MKIAATLEPNNVLIILLDLILCYDLTIPLMHALFCVFTYCMYYIVGRDGFVILPPLVYEVIAPYRKYLLE